MTDTAIARQSRAKMNLEQWRDYLMPGASVMFHSDPERVRKNYILADPEQDCLVLVVEYKLMSRDEMNADDLSKAGFRLAEFGRAIEKMV